jgi:hypothetical protein
MMINHQGGRGSVERFFVERDSSRREELRGETRRGGRSSGERISLWRDPSRREELRGEPGQLNTCKAASTRSHLYITH